MALECFRQVLGSIFDKICRGADDDEEEVEEEEEQEQEQEEGDDDDEEEVEELAEAFGWLPDCLVIDIVSRLPIDTLVRCRSDLRAFTSSHHFTTLHLSRARQRPMVLLYDAYEDTSKRLRHKQIYVIDKTGQLTYLSRQPIAINNSKLSIRSTCQGVVLLADYTLAPTTYYVLNPITQEEVIIQHTHQPGRLCGLYYCCRDHLFKLLYVQVAESGTTLCQYLVYIFKTRTWRKIRSSSSFNFLPITCSPAVVNGALHWIMKRGLPPRNSCGNNGIIVFRMDNEQLSAKPHPGSHVCNGHLREHRTMRLFVKEKECLYFCHLLNSEHAVDIWMLEDYEMWAWNKRYKIDLFRYYYSGRQYNWPRRMQLIAIQDGLLVFKACRRLFFYDLDRKTVVKGLQLPENMMLDGYGSYIKTMLAIA